MSFLTTRVQIDALGRCGCEVVIGYDPLMLHL